jgi:hypothetical protein
MVGLLVALMVVMMAGLWVVVWADMSVSHEAVD